MSQITNYNNVFDYITSQEENYRKAIPINEKWNWSMKDHILTTELYNNSQSHNKTEWTPIRNIIRPILNLQHRTEDIELKDVQIYVDDPEKYHLSFLVKKYHDDVFVQENDLDTFFDELNVSRIDFGGGISKQLNKPAPEVVPLQSIAFCDQTDVLSGPVGLKHYYSPDQLLDMEQFGWGKESNGATITVDQLITLSREEKKDNNTNDQAAQTPGRYIEVYEVHGNLPKKFFDKTDTSGKYETRLCICAFYQKKDSGDKQGVILYTALEKESPFKMIKRDPVYGRALGFGGAEELFEAQVWVNYDMIRIQDMLDAASKTILKATGQNSANIAAQNNIKDVDNLKIIDVGEGSDLGQVDTYPRNMALFDRSMEQWEAHAQQMGAANDALMGKSPTAGTPFKLQELVTMEGRGLHDYRRGQYAKHIEEIYRDWIIPHIEKKITEGTRFLSELSLEELQYVAERVSVNQSNKRIKDLILSGETVTPEQQQAFTELYKEQFNKKGNKQFIEILKGEFKDSPLAVKVTVQSKSKDLSGRVDKITNIFRFAFSNPQGFAQVMQIPGMAKGFSEILEYSGLSPVDFSGIDQLAISKPQNESAVQVPEKANVQ